MSGWADGAKGVPCFLIHHHIHRLNDSTCGVTGSFERTMTHDGVAVETVDFVRLWLAGFKRAQVFARMNQGKAGIADFLSFGSLQMPPNILAFEFGFDNGGAFGRVGMSRAGLVSRKNGMRNPDRARIFTQKAA